MSGTVRAGEREALFSLHGVDVRFGRVPALAGATLSIHAGERVALIGANGSGKSTLLRLLHGLRAACRPALRQPRRAARQAMLFQRPHMLRASVRNNVALALWLPARAGAHARREAAVALGRVGLAELAGRNARTLSGGQQQRLALARAWALQPDVLLLDEPTASLDPTAKREVEALIADAAHGRTLVFASHNLGQVKRLASRVVYLEHGRVLADLPVHDFFNGPLPEEARLFVKGEMRMKMSFNAILAPSALATAGCRAAPGHSAETITMASTTSTEQSGLFAHLLPAFKQASGIDVKVVAVGTGQALDMAGAATPTCCSCTTPRPRRSSSPKASRPSACRSCTTTSCWSGPKSDPAGVQGQGHRRRAEEDRGGQRALRLARRQERHPRGRAPLVERRPAWPRQASPCPTTRRAAATRNAAAAWARRSTSRRRAAPTC